MILLWLIGIALIDSLNPSIILMTLFLLTTRRPLPRVASYIAAVFLTNWALGMLVYFSLGATFSLLILQVTETTAWWAYALELVAAIAILVSAYFIRTDKEPEPGKKPRNLHPGATFVLGVGATFLEFSTAAPYLAAIALLTRAEPSTVFVITFLGIYNLIYVGIPLLLVGYYVIRRDSAGSFFASVGAKVKHWINRILKVVLFGLGAVLLADFIGWVFGNPLF